MLCVFGLHEKPLINIAYRMTRAEKRRHPGKFIAVAGQKCSRCGKLVTGTDKIVPGNA